MAAKKPPRTLAEKIDHLFGTVRPAHGEYTHEQVATAIADAGGPTISATYLWQLRKGLRDNPTKHHIEALSSFFGVPAAYFFDEDTSRIDADLALLTAIRNPRVRHLLSLSDGLDDEVLRPLTEVLTRVRQLEGLPEVSTTGGRRRRRPAAS